MLWGGGVRKTYPTLPSPGSQKRLRGSFRKIECPICGGLGKFVNKSPKEQAMEAFTKLVSFLVGVILVVFGVIDQCPRLGAVVIGLLLMGVFSVNEAMKIIRGLSTEKGREKDD